jgi:hypothetical protein
MNKFVTKFVSPNPAGLQVLKIVSENISLLEQLVVHKSMIHKTLRRIVTCGILGLWTMALGQVIIF